MSNPSRSPGEGGDRGPSLKIKPKTKPKTKPKAKAKPVSQLIIENFATSQFDKQDFNFLPDGVLDKILSREAILQAFGVRRLPGKVASEAQNCLADFVLEKARKVFAIAVMVGLEGDLQEGMQEFKLRGIVDERLPLTQDVCIEMGLLKTKIAPSDDGDDDDDGDDGDDHDDEDADETDNEATTESLSSSGDGDENEYNDGYDTDEEDDCRSVWSAPRISFFRDKQWSFLSPVFDLTEVDYTLDKSTILPFIRRDDRTDSGSFGQVSECEIHQCHLRDDPAFSCGKLVAVKELLPNKKDRQKLVHNWEKEVQVLQKMNQLNQPHIVRFLTAFQRGDKDKEDYYLMLEWANGGNLRNLWDTFNRPELTCGLVKATVNQILGLTNALSKAHYPYTDPNWAHGALHFRHGDLKPENILWFKDEAEGAIGTLKIGDWGLAKEHKEVTELRKNRTTTDWGTRSYEPPEEETGDGVNLDIPGQAGNKRSRLYDVWAMGCITLEFLIWLVYGLDELRRFNNSIQTHSVKIPCFYQTFLKPGGNRGARVHDVVTRWIAHMEKEPICRAGSTALGSLLELVKNKLLVVQLPRGLGTSAVDSKGIATQRPEKPTSLTNRSKQTVDDIPPLSPHEIPNPTIVVDEVVPSEGLSRQDVRGESLRMSRFKPDSKWERANALQFQTQLQSIVDEGDDESYWFPGHNKSLRGPPDTEDAAETSSHVTNAPITPSADKGLQAHGVLPLPRTERVVSV